MKLLITTQAVDLDDPVLGFMHRWIEALAGKVESIDVVCLKEGRHSLPKNVTVRSLGKEGGASRIKYLLRFYGFLFSLRCDAVFVHMNSEYVVLGGWWWKLRGVRIVLWRNHKMRDVWTSIAARFANTICYTSPTAFVSRFPHATKMPIGIDTEVFKPSGSSDPKSILFLGRLDEVKRPDVFLEAMQLLEQNGVDVRADVYGDPTPGREAYADALKKRFADLRNVSFHAGVPNAATPALYASHGIYVNLTPSGSFDKTIGEAMACGAIAVVNNDAVRAVVLPALMAGLSVGSAAAAIHNAFELPADERAKLSAANRSYIEHEHSLTLLVDRLIRLFGRV